MDGWEKAVIALIVVCLLLLFAISFGLVEDQQSIGITIESRSEPSK